MRTKFMGPKSDLHSILISYANKYNSPFVDPDTFILFLGGYVNRYVEEYPEWQRWKDDMVAKFWRELAAIAEDGKCELLHDTPSGRIYLPYFYQKYLDQYYNNIDDNADLPFPSEESLGIIIPENQFKSYVVGSELSAYMEEPKKKNTFINKCFFHIFIKMLGNYFCYHI